MIACESRALTQSIVFAHNSIEIVWQRFFAVCSPEWTCASVRRQTHKSISFLQINTFLNYKFSISRQLIINNFPCVCADVFEWSMAMVTTTSTATTTAMVHYLLQVSSSMNLISGRDAGHITHRIGEKCQKCLVLYILFVVDRLQVSHRVWMSSACVSAVRAIRASSSQSNRRRKSENSFLFIFQLNILSATSQASASASHTSIRLDDRHMRTLRSSDKVFTSQIDLIFTLFALVRETDWLNCHWPLVCISVCALSKHHTGLYGNRSEHTNSQRTRDALKPPKNIWKTQSICER